MQTHTGFHFVHVLSSGAGAAERIPTDAGWVHFHFNRIVNQRHYEYGSKRGHTLALCVIRTHTHQTMHTVLGFQITVCHIAFDIESHGLDARFIAFLQVLDRHFVIMFLAIALVHTHELFCPVLRFGTTCAGNDLQHGGHLVFLMRKHVLHLQIFHLVQRLGISGIHLFFGH